MKKRINVLMIKRIISGNNSFISLCFCFFGKITVFFFLLIAEYIDFWLDNVHCYRTDVHNELNQSSVDLNPPVIIVGTGIDKIALVSF